jgi:hypothetical protein
MQPNIICNSFVKPTSVKNGAELLKYRVTPISRSLSLLTLKMMSESVKVLSDLTYESRNVKRLEGFKDS